MKFRKTHIQSHSFPATQVFPLLSPEGESEWLEDWNYKMIHSHSGKTEKGCVFSTDHHSHGETIWIVTNHEPERQQISFVRFSPGKNVTEIAIKVMPTGEESSTSHIEYSYIPLSTAEHERLKGELDTEFETMMEWWEKAINYFLKTGKRLAK